MERHPEQHDDEFYFTNTATKQFEGIEWKTKRLGNVAYNLIGKAMPAKWGCKPVFVKNEEVQAFGIDPVSITLKINWKADNQHI